MTDLEQYAHERNMTLREAILQKSYNHLRQHPETKFTLTMLANGIGLGKELVRPAFTTLGVKPNLAILERTKDGLEFTLQYRDPWSGGLTPPCAQEGKDPYGDEP